jgi:hypothetical protein
VQIGSTEYTFGGGGGVFTHPAKEVSTAKFRESILLGEFDGTSRDIDSALDELRPKFAGDSYNLLLKNCNHFADAFSTRLLHKPIPDYVNRMAYIGSYFSCLLPPSMTGQAPVDSAGDAGAGGGYTMSGGRGRPGATAAPIEGRGFASAGIKLGADTSSSSETEPLMDELVIKSISSSSYSC